MATDKPADVIREGRAILGIEFGSTRIKAVAIDENNAPIASGEYSWENRLIDNIWTYSMDDIMEGLSGCYRNLKEQVRKQYGVVPTSFAAIGFSAMMHGYLAFDAQGNLLVPFRTWRNTMTEEAADKLSALFEFNIPQRWSIAHLYQAILNRESHIRDISYLTTLAGYIHWRMTGRKVLGAGDASGMFPIDSGTGDYRQDLIEKFEDLIKGEEYPWSLREILPEVLFAGQDAGTLNGEGAQLLDPEGDLVPGIPVCPPEGDAGTGMTATNSVAQQTGNVSAGTSIFAMMVLERDLSSYYKEIDIVTTPAGDPVAMVHCNNGTSDLDAWIELFGETLRLFDAEPDARELYGRLYREALKGDADCGGLLAYNYFSGESITEFDQGRPLFVRRPDSTFNLANFMRTHLLASLGTLKIGMDILKDREGVTLEKIYGHGGLFKTEGVAQRLLAAAIDTPVYVMDTAGEGGAWGIALLASYMKNRKEDETLAQFLSDTVFCGAQGTGIWPDPDDTAGFERFMERFRDGLAIERAAEECL